MYLSKISWDFPRGFTRRISTLVHSDRTTSPWNGRKQQVKRFPVFRRNTTGNGRDTGAGFTAIANCANLRPKLNNWHYSPLKQLRWRRGAGYIMYVIRNSLLWQHSSNTISYLMDCQRSCDLITISCALLCGVATPVSDCRKLPFGLSHRSRYPLFSWAMGSVTKSHLHFEHLLAWCGAENMGPICQFGALLIRKYCWSCKGFLSTFCTFWIYT